MSDDNQKPLSAADQLSAAMDSFASGIQRNPAPDLPSPQPTMQASPQSAVQQPIQPQAPAPNPQSPLSDSMDQMAAAIGSDPNTPNRIALQNQSKLGSAPMAAIPDSPLNILQRVGFGWATPKKKLTYLKGEFGDDNVKLVPMDGDNANFVVKDNGVWKQVDPHGTSDISIKGALGGALAGGLVAGPGGLIGGATLGANKNEIEKQGVGGFVKNQIGSLAQFVGEHPEIVAQGSAGAALGAELGQAAIPIPFIGAGIGGVAGMAIGAGLGALEKQGVRKVVSALSPDNSGGDPNALDPEELKRQIGLSMLMGTSAELAGRAMVGGANLATKGTGKLIGTMIERSSVPGRFLDNFFGLGDMESRQWAENPQGPARFWDEAIKDDHNATHNVDDMAKDAARQTFEGLREARGEVGLHYQALEDQAEDARINPLKPLDDGSMPFEQALNNLKRQGLFGDDNKRLTPQSMSAASNPISKILNSAGNPIAGAAAANPDVVIPVNLTGPDAQLADALSNNYKIFQGADKNDKAIPYLQMKNAKQQLEALMFSNNPPTNGALKDAARQFRDGIDSTMARGLEELEPGLSAQKANLDSIYAPIKSMLEETAGKDDGTKLETLLRATKKADGKYNSGLMDAISEAAGDKSRVEDIKDMVAAQKAVPGIVGSKTKVAGVPIWGQTPRMGAGIQLGLQNNIINPINQMGQQIADTSPAKAVAPYLRTLHDTYSGFSDDVRKSFLADPNAQAQIESLINARSQSQEQDQKNLINQIGSFQGANFGQQQR